MTVSGKSFIGLVASIPILVTHIPARGGIERMSLGVFNHNASCSGFKQVAMAWITALSLKILTSSSTTTTYLTKRIGCQDRADHIFGFHVMALFNGDIAVRRQQPEGGINTSRTVGQAMRMVL
jgi:hypothetical protein